MEITGRIPSFPLYKFFEESEHAQSFMKGNVFFGRQKY